MRIGLQSISSLIRAGDYFVLGNGKEGNTVQYSPDAPPGAQVVGSFGSCKGLVAYYDAEDTARRVAGQGGVVEAYEALLCSEVEGLAVMSRRQVAGTMKLENDGDIVDALSAIRLTAQAVEPHTPEFEGSVKDLLNFLGTNLPSSRYQKFARRLKAEFPTAATVLPATGRGPGAGMQVRVDWDRIRAGYSPDAKF